MQLKALREAANVVRLMDKIRMNAVGCLLNLVVNRGKQLLSLLDPKTDLSPFLIGLLQELVDVHQPLAKKRLLAEQISTLLKVALDKLGSHLDLSAALNPALLPQLLSTLKTQTPGPLLHNLVNAIGVVLKVVPHAAEFNKVGRTANPVVGVLSGAARAGVEGELGDDDGRAQCLLRRLL